MAELNTSEKSSSKTKKMSKKVDLTAMVDLAFLLITFFMLTTTLSKPTAMNIIMPFGDEPSPVKLSNTLTLCLGANNKLAWYSGTNENPDNFDVTNFDKNGIRSVLINRSKNILQQTGKNLMVLVKPSNHSQYKNLVDIIDELNITKIPSYAIVDITKEDISRLEKKGIY
ncbi:hypothetical protein A5893_04065 [Pedobacter psychrophilus]|uniref:Biopolymer transporter ExbD n=1 Tax=Pedobacter psychrophilus TaxID=1826909 RepID=A0A179DMJ3_9SPHI|nr:biopolymer transporter ExbD [Pedobacter psychrophilus]OAQ42296.1 hypothetical protein A5893_04065 [Pedobacter psychrophilus]